MLDPRSEALVAARVISLLYVALGGAGLLSVVLGNDGPTDDEAVAIIGLVTVLIGLLAFALASRLSPHLFGPALVGGVGVIAGYTLAAGEVDSPHIMLFGWLSIVAWLCLSPPAATALTVTVIVSSGLVMLSFQGPDPDGDTWWAFSSLSLVAVSGLAGVLRARGRLTIVLGEAATHDELTGLLNRRALHQRLDEEIARTRRYGTPVSVVVADLDQFKAVNDSFGHAAGDEALRQFARVCAGELRSVDYVCRVGGEEFAVVLPNASSAQAVVTAERIRQAVSTALHRPDGVPITASFGVACFPTDADESRTLLSRADEAMYRGKQLGRNRVVAFGERPRGDTGGPLLVSDD